MPVIPDDKKHLPTVTLGGEQWAVAPMSARKIIRFGALTMGLDLGKPGGETLGAMFECAWLAVSTVHKDIKLESFLDNYHITFQEALAAFPEMSKAAGMEFGKKGEAQADPLAETISSTDGTAS